MQLQLWFMTYNIPHADYAISDTTTVRRQILLWFGQGSMRSGAATPHTYEHFWDATTIGSLSMDLRKFILWDFLFRPWRGGDANGYD